MTWNTIGRIIGGVLCTASVFCMVYTFGADRQFEADKKAVTELLDDLGYTVCWYDRQIVAVPKIKH